MKRMKKMFLAVICCMFVVGCSTSEKDIPDSVTVMSFLSSFRPGVITNKEDVEYLWNLYENFEYGKTIDIKDTGKDWPYDVTFINSQTNKEVNFTLYGNGSCCFSNDVDNIRMLEDGRKIYEEFKMYGEKASWIND